MVRYNTTSSKRPLTSYHIALLKILKTGIWTTKELEKRLNKSAAIICGTLHMFKARGWVIIRKAPSTRGVKINLYVLTNEGKKLLKQVEG